MAYMTKERKVREVTEHLWKWIAKFIEEGNSTALARHLRYAAKWKIPVEIEDWKIVVGGRTFELNEETGDSANYYRQAIERM